MSPTLPPHLLADWITSRLEPADGSAHPYRAALPMRSDFDLNPGQHPGESVPLVHAAVLAPLIAYEGGFHMLLTRRSDAMRKHSGQVAFPGGRSDPGETPVQTALREAHEEIGLDPGLVTVAGLSTPYRTGTGFLITPVVGFINPGFAPIANPDEVADVFETPFAFLMDPQNHQKRHYDSDDGIRRHFYAMPYERWNIWGATAGMLRALYDRLYGEQDALVDA